MYHFVCYDDDNQMVVSKHFEREFQVFQNDNVILYFGPYNDQT